MLIAQITDLHIQHGGKHAERIQAQAHLAACVHTLNALDPRPDLVAITGDLTEHGRPDEYETLKRLLEGLDIPFVMIPGNHDHPQTLRDCFPEHQYLQSDSPFVQYVLEDWPLRIIGLDTTIPRSGQGRLCPDRLAWLAETLAQAPDRPTLLIMHHPPFDTGIREMDKLGLIEGRDAFVQVIEPYRNIERILCGHLHRTIICRVGNTLASTCPGTAHQIALDLRHEATLSFNFEPPGYQLHWQGRHGLVSHHALIGEFPGPYPF
ncbi:phosphodiesterase [Allopusillimonas ginsengisoli]|uniref:phosphodiesterase n=1 Tax=Allopusillimonas ginsengisoli TaxID=453575 RepID=UPI001021C5E5|nr:phosphodiesterase [Allopusillimonas ginsengisoli]TEA77046.1 phosphodiesterase [Allopusillimonas ginsengisoli]